MASKKTFIIGTATLDANGGATLSIQPMTHAQVQAAAAAAANAGGRGRRDEGCHVNSLDPTQALIIQDSPPSATDVYELILSGQFEVAPCKMNLTTRQIYSYLGSVQRNLGLFPGQQGEWNADAQSRLLKWLQDAKRGKKSEGSSTSGTMAITNGNAEGTSSSSVLAITHGNTNEEAKEDCNQVVKGDSQFKKDSTTSSSRSSDDSDSDEGSDGDNKEDEDKEDVVSNHIVEDEDEEQDEQDEHDVQIINEIDGQSFKVSANMPIEEIRNKVSAEFDIPLDKLLVMIKWVLPNDGQLKDVVPKKETLIAVRRP